MLCTGVPESVKVIFADTDVLTVALTLTLPLAVEGLGVMLPIGVSSAEDGTGVLICLIVLKFSGAGALTVKLEGFLQSRLSEVETQQFQ